MIKKDLLIILLVLFVFIFNKGLIAQNYLGSYHIEHKEGNKWSENRYKWKTETRRYNSDYRNVEFDLKFASNCEYILGNPGYQCYKPDIDKILKITKVHSKRFDSLLGPN